MKVKKHIQSKKQTMWRQLPLLDYCAIVAIALIFFAVVWNLMYATEFMLFGQIIPRVTTTEKVVALTFDDGPLPVRTEETLAVLKREKVTATFFVIGKEAVRHNDQLRKIIAAGHEVGNHSYSHRMLAFLPPADIAREVEKTDDVIREAGYEGEIPFRVPYNIKLVTLPYYLSTHDRPAISRDVLPEEGVGRTAEEIAEEVVSKTRPGSIILLHPMYKHTASSRRAIPLIIQQLHEQGYTFVTASELLTYRTRT